MYFFKHHISLSTTEIPTSLV